MARKFVWAPRGTTIRPQLTGHTFGAMQIRLSAQGDDNTPTVDRTNFWSYAISFERPGGRQYAQSWQDKLLELCSVSWVLMSHLNYYVAFATCTSTFFHSVTPFHLCAHSSTQCHKQHTHAHTHTQTHTHTHTHTCHSERRSWSAWLNSVRCLIWAVPSRGWCTTPLAFQHSGGCMKCSFHEFHEWCQSQYPALIACMGEGTNGQQVRATGI